MTEKDKKIFEFEDLLKSTERENIDSLITFIKKSDFYKAPASTRYHSCHEGGLLEHSLNVYDCLINKINNPTWEKLLNEVSSESITIISLLHDICKIYYYEVEMKNKKIYSETGKKTDAHGRYDWETVQGYTINDLIPYGHGEKSVMIIEEFIKLKPVERYAIRWHMGFTEPKENWNNLGQAIKKYPLILAVHQADLESTYLLEKEE